MYLVPGCSQATVAELSGLGRDCIVHKAEPWFSAVPLFSLLYLCRKSLPTLQFLLTSSSRLQSCCVRMHAKSLQLCLTLCDPMDRSPPGSSVHGILQARRVEWVAMPASRGSSQPRDRTHISLCFLHWQVGSLLLGHMGSPPIQLSPLHLAQGCQHQPPASFLDRPHMPRSACVKYASFKEALQKSLWMVCSEFNSDVPYNGRLSSGILSISTTDIWDWIVLCGGAILCILWVLF